MGKLMQMKNNLLCIALVLLAVVSGQGFAATVFVDGFDTANDGRWTVVETGTASWAIDPENSWIWGAGGFEIQHVTDHVIADGETATFEIDIDRVAPEYTYFGDIIAWDGAAASVLGSYSFTNVASPGTYTVDISAGAGQQLGVTYGHVGWGQSFGVQLDVGDPPTPDPMTWAALPYAKGPFTVAMEATTASDSGGVEYFFTCISGGGHNSGWQDSPVYEDRILRPGTTYTYTVKARDFSQNETAPSTAESAATDYSPFAGPVVGYAPFGWQIPTTLNYSEVTHINMAFMRVYTNGDLDDSAINYTELANLVTNGHLANVKVSISCGGGGSINFGEMASSSTTRANFVSQITQFCLDYNLDGVDMDWEEPYGFTAQDRTNYSSLLQELHASLSLLGLQLTMAGNSWSHEINPTAFQYLDWVNVMTYDMGFPDHSTFQDMLNGIAYWENYGMPREKIVVGVPFYGYRDTWASARTYAWIYDTYQPAPDVDLVDGYGFNGIDMITQKTNYAFTNGYGGMMIWQLGQDKLNHPASLLNALASTARLYGPPMPMDMISFANLAANWRQTGCGFCGGADLSGNGNVDVADLQVMAENWLADI
jgi:spore germination protein YaaH